MRSQAAGFQLEALKVEAASSAVMDMLFVKKFGTCGLCTLALD